MSPQAVAPVRCEDHLDLSLAPASTRDGDRARGFGRIAALSSSSRSSSWLPTAGLRRWRQASGRRRVAGLVELVDERPESLLCAALVGGVVECLPVPPADAFAFALAFAFGQLGWPPGCASGPRSRRPRSPSADRPRGRAGRETTEGMQSGATSVETRGSGTLEAELPPRPRSTRAPSRPRTPPWRAWCWPSWPSWSPSSPADGPVAGAPAGEHGRAAWASTRAANACVAASAARARSAPTPYPGRRAGAPPGARR